jgi:hypothetical protein
VSDPGPVRLICDAASPPLDYVDDDGEVLDLAVRFRCQKSQGHRGDHSIRLEWSRDVALLAVPPWREPNE